MTPQDAEAGATGDAGEAADAERYLVVDGRRWRRADPTLPEAVREELLSHLGRGRSGVRQAKREADEQAVTAARRRVGLAKHGLGERGDAWWEQTEAERRARWQRALDELRTLDD